MAKNVNYWKSEHNTLHKRVDNDALQLDAIYRKKLNEVEGQLKDFYKEYAVNNNITEDIARSILTPKEFNAFNSKLRQWIKSGRYSDDKSFLATIERLKGTSKIDRLQRLQTELTAKLSDLKSEQIKTTETSLTNTYKDTEGATANIVENQFNQASEAKIRTVINSEFQERRLSGRVWTHRSNLRNKLITTLNDNFTEGKNWNDLKSDLKRTFGASDFEARRLLITETARINSVAKENSFSEAGFTHYQYIAVDDDKTTPICNGLDDKIFRIEDMKVGVNAPPVHIYCRSTIVPYEFD